MRTLQAFGSAKRRFSGWVGGALLAALVASSSVAHAGPDPSKIKAASESFEQGASAYRDERFEEAAALFEAADSASPGSKSLRLAIKARTKAKQLSRAATLAALALDRYTTEEEEIRKVATDTLAEAAPKLHRVDVSCVSPCLLAVGSRIVHGEPATRRVLYVDPGKVTIGASFLGKIPAKDQTITATVNGQSSIRFEPPRDGAPQAETPSGKPNQGSKDNEPKGSDGPKSGAPSEGEPKGQPDRKDGSSEGAQDPVEPSKASTWRIHPAFFFVGLGATAGLGAATIWSGVDTKNNPGPDAVREGCVGQGESCALYQDGQAKEVRTNALIGATAGAAAVTLVLGLVSDWGGSDPVAGDDAPKSAGLSLLPRLWVEVPDGTSRGPGTPAVHAEISGRF